MAREEPESLRTEEDEICQLKDLLARHPDVEEAGFEFKDERLEKRVANRLAYHNIEPVQ